GVELGAPKPVVTLKLRLEPSCIWRMPKLPAERTTCSTHPSAPPPRPRTARGADASQRDPPQTGSAIELRSYSARPKRPGTYSVHAILRSLGDAPNYAIQTSGN